MRYHFPTKPAKNRGHGQGEFPKQAFDVIARYDSEAKKCPNRISPISCIFARWGNRGGHSVFGGREAAQDPLKDHSVGNVSFTFFNYRSHCRKKHLTIDRAYSAMSHGQMAP